MKKTIIFLLLPFIFIGCKKKEVAVEPPSEAPAVSPLLDTPEKSVEEKKEDKPPTPVEKAIEEAKKELPVGILDPIINKVQENYNKMKDLEVNVTQSVKKVLKPKPTISKGVIKVIKPNKIFWLTTEPEALKTVADGTTIWVYDPGAKQVFIQPQAESNNQTKIAMLFLSGKGKITDEFLIGFKKGNLYEWKLIPKEKIPQVKSIEASVNRETKWFDKLVIEYTYDETVELKFDDYKENQGLEAAHRVHPIDPNISPDFRLEVPPDTKIIKSPK